MNLADDNQSETSQKDLAAGILKQAAQDLRRFHGAPSKVERELYLDAYRWAISDDCSWPFSFLNVCELLNLPPHVALGEFLGDASIGFFGYWTRRCLRGARSFQSSLNRLFTTNRNSTAVDPIPLTVHAFSIK